MCKEIRKIFFYSFKLTKFDPVKVNKIIWYAWNLKLPKK